ncbi:MAG: isochorismatase family cysteine hydrolase [archaeon]|jgi:nicotinamidase-related amidase
MPIKTIDLDNSVLLVIDVVNSCCSEKCEIKKWNITYKKIRKMIPNLERFIVNYKAITKRPVIYIKTTPWRKEFLTKNLIELYKNPDCNYYSLDKTGYSEELYLLKPTSKDYVLEKNTYDAFTNKNLEIILHKLKVKNIIIAGVFADGCVNSTIINGFSKGYNFIILEDLVETTDKKERQDIKNLLIKYTWRQMYGKIVKSKDLLRSLETK